MANSNNISKEAILNFINERISERSKSLYTKDEYHKVNDACIGVFTSIRTLINQGIFDVESNESPSLETLVLAQMDTNNKKFKEFLKK